jgi:biopolymer transport protein ExbD
MRRRFGRRDHEPPELNITAFMNLMVVLVPFLLLTAVFSQITVLDLNLPATASAASAADDRPRLRLELIVREDGIEVADRGRDILAQAGRAGDGYDYAALAAALVRIKRQHPDHREATLLLEPEVPYDVLVQVMDATRSAPADGGRRVELFPELGIGDAPERRP